MAHTNTTTTDSHAARRAALCAPPTSGLVDARQPQTRSRTATAVRVRDESEGAPAAKRAQHSVSAPEEVPRPARGAPLFADRAQASTTAVPPVVDVAASAAPPGAPGGTARGSTKSCGARPAGAGADRN